MEKVVGLCKRRGFIFPSAEIYGGFRSTYDYGPLGVNLLRNVKNAWWEAMVQRRDDVVGLDAAILSPPAVWEASGHLANFTDPLVDCRNCHQRWRAGQDRRGLPQLRLHRLHRGPGLQPDVQDPRRPGRGRGRGGLPAARDGPGHVHQLRQRAPDHPQEAALRHRPGGQVLPQRDHPAELRLPHPGVRADGDGVLRPARPRPDSGSSTGWTSGTAGTRTWASPTSELRLRHHDADELSHYSAATADVEFLFPWGWDELEGIANRTDFDLVAHAEASGERLEYFDQATGERYVPYVIEPAAGATRTMMAFLLSAYHEDEVGGRAPAPCSGCTPDWPPTRSPCSPCRRRRPSSRWPARSWPRCSPHFMCDYDVTQSIGKRYRRQDEVGTPWCVTVDFDSLEDRAVTVRDRDTTDQVRVPIDGLVDELRRRTDGALTGPDGGRVQVRWLLGPIRIGPTVWSWLRPASTTSPPWSPAGLRHRAGHRPPVGRRGRRR